MINPLQPQRGEDVALPLWRVVFDPPEFGGEERGAPMADRARTHDSKIQQVPVASKSVRPVDVLVIRGIGDRPVLVDIDGE